MKKQKKNRRNMKKKTIKDLQCPKNKIEIMKNHERN